MSKEGLLGQLKCAWQRLAFRALRPLMSIRRQERPVRFILSRMLWGTRLCILCRIRFADYELRFWPTSLSASLWINPRDRIHDEAFVRGYLRSGDIVIDVGANIGSIAVPCALTVGRCGVVVALEPNPRVCGYLRANVTLNGLHNLSVIQAAAGEDPGTVGFVDQRSDDQARVGEPVDGQIVPLLRVDDLNLPDRAVALLKVDIEGFELFALRGARRTLSRTECVYFEMSESHFAHYGYHCRDVVTLLTDAGFAVYSLRDGYRAPRPYQVRDCSNRAENFMAIRDMAGYRARLASSA